MIEGGVETRAKLILTFIRASEISWILQEAWKGCQL